MTNFKVGQTIVCINAGSLSNRTGKEPPLKLHAKYVISGIDTCACGVVSLDVGLASQGGNMICFNCPREVANDPVWWCAAKRFMPLDEFEGSQTESLSEEQLEKKIKEAIGVEDYELAANLKRQLEKKKQSVA